MTVADLEQRLGVGELDWWRAYDAVIQPLGDQRLARQMALFACLYANAHRGTHRPWDIDDFDLFKERIPLTQAEEEERFRSAWREAGFVVTVATPPNGEALHGD